MRTHILPLSAGNSFTGNCCYFESTVIACLTGNICLEGKGVVDICSAEVNSFVRSRKWLRFTSFSWGKIRPLPVLFYFVPHRQAQFEGFLRVNELTFCNSEWEGTVCKNIVQMYDAEN